MKLKELLLCLSDTSVYITFDGINKSLYNVYNLSCSDKTIYKNLREAEVFSIHAHGYDDRLIIAL